MDPATIALIALIIAVIALSLYSFKQMNEKLQELKEQSLKADQADVMKMLNVNMEGMQKRIDQSTVAMNERLDNAARVIAGVNKELGSMSEIGRSIKDFQAFLNSPKIRGNLGEQILYDAISQVFNQDQYATQYKFKEGHMVDAIIRTSEGIIPVDSKFPMEMFKKILDAENEKERNTVTREFVRSVKKHVDDISNKYILPQEGTVDFAVMYIPSEQVFYEIVMNSEELLDYAHTKKVHLVSPNTFLYYLRTIMMGLERSKLQEEAQRIWETLKALQQENVKFGKHLDLVGRHLTNAKNAMDTATSEYGKFSTKIEQVKLLKE